MKKYTIYLFFFSIFMSLVSLLLIEKGYKEMYPFASWKLFTVPSGGAVMEERFVLYGYKNSDSVRIIYTDSEKYDANDKAAIIDNYGRKIVNNKDKEMSRSKLLIFAKEIEPQFNEYILFLENYNPKEIGEKKMKINRKLIIRL